MRKKFKIFLLLISAFWLVSSFKAQDLTAARYEIDAKRIGVDPAEKDALPRSREFLRLDSTYYVGWMFEGIYKFERSSDLMGYRQAITPLRKALRLFEKDFGNKMRNLYSSYTFFQQNLSRYDDFFVLVNALKSSYNSIEMPDSTMALLDKIESYHFQKDFFTVYSERSWIYHRNRFYKQKDHSFLKNSVEENEVLAFKNCYLQLGEIKKNKALNDGWYGSYQSNEDYMTVYHYLALLHNYNRQYDSAEYYYNILAEGGRISWSNYANMMHEVGNFSDAITYYKKPQFRRRFSLEEADYYLPMMLIYGGRTKEALQISSQKITESGSTPGFGWYTIGLARGYLYDGQIDSCEFYLDKAANFKELHINTTLTQSQYEFTINLLRIQMMDKKAALIKFLNTGWWYSPSDIFDLMLINAQKLMLEYNVVNALANNPERKRIVYDLFCAETTVTYDESMYLLKDFSLPYFRKMYTYYSLNDVRNKVNRYFRFFEAKFLFEGGDEESAASECKLLLEQTLPSAMSQGNDPDIADVPNEKLFFARLFEILARSDENNSAVYSVKMYRSFPQLVPFSGVKMPLYLSSSGLNDQVTEKVREQIEDCNIEFSNDPNAIKANIHFEKKSGSYMAVINVIDEFGNEIVKDQKLIFKENMNVGGELALRLFAKGGALKY